MHLSSNAVLQTSSLEICDIDAWELVSSAGCVDSPQERARPWMAEPELPWMALLRFLWRVNTACAAPFRRHEAAAETTPYGQCTGQQTL